jgi:anti-sigma regulatory factor (Ser/Thr protein kinase)
MRHQQRLHLTLREGRGATAELRRAVEELSTRARLKAGDCFDLKVAATEAVTNALKGTAYPQTVEVTLAVEDDTVEIEVADRGIFSPLRAALQRGLDAEGGRGVAMMIALVDDVEFQRTESGTRVLLRKHVTRVRPALRLAG